MIYNSCYEIWCFKNALHREWAKKTNCASFHNSSLLYKYQIFRYIYIWYSHVISFKYIEKTQLLSILHVTSQIIAQCIQTSNQNKSN